MIAASKTPEESCNNRRGSSHSETRVSQHPLTKKPPEVVAQCNGADVVGSQSNTDHIIIDADVVDIGRPPPGSWLS